MRFTKSLDGAMRVTVRVDFRMDASAAAEALAIQAVGEVPAVADISRATKQEVARALRELLANTGPPEQWNEYDGDPDWPELRRLAGERVAELWPGVRADG